jgi:hypothetical protein
MARPYWLVVCVLLLFTQRSEAEPDGSKPATETVRVNLDLTASFQDRRFNQAHILRSLGGVSDVKVTPAALGKVEVGSFESTPAGLLGRIAFSWPQRLGKGTAELTLLGKRYFVDFNPKWATKGDTSTTAAFTVANPTWVVVRSARIVPGAPNERQVELVLENFGTSVATIDSVSVNARYVSEAGGHLSCANASPWQDAVFAWKTNLEGNVLSLTVDSTLGDTATKTDGSFKSLACSGYPKGSYDLRVELPTEAEVPVGGVARLRLRLRDAVRGINLFVPKNVVSLVKCQTITIGLPEPALPRRVELRPAPSGS